MMIETSRPAEAKRARRLSEWQREKEEDLAEGGPLSLSRMGGIRNNNWQQIGKLFPLLLLLLM